MGDNQFQTSGITVQGRSAFVNALYNQYSAMLLGYIFEVVKNMADAEQYLIAVFKDVPHELDELSKTGVNTFCYLQLMARKKLSGFFEAIDECAGTEQNSKTIANSKNKYVGLMTTDQQHVFCGIYWHGKTVAKLAEELGKAEDAVRKLLKECFTIIRSSNI
jgi:DNA-directed RNA polymerase specialized sigma24 family protein